MWGIVIIYLFWLPAASFAEVYKYVDEEGNVVFTDRQRPGSVEVEGLPPADKKTPAAKPRVMPRPSLFKKPPSPAPAEESFSRYQRVKIIAPADDTAMRNNAGNVSIELELKPKLQRQLGHQLIVWLDDKKLPQRWDKTPIVLQNVDRGTHRLKVAVVDNNGKRLKTSSSITFHLHRASILFRP